LRAFAFTSVALSMFATLTSLWLAAPATPGPHALLPLEDAKHPIQRPAPVDAAADFLRTQHSGLSDTEIPIVAEVIVREATRLELDLDLVLALIFVESAGYTFAVSPVGARGLMQIMPPTGEELARRMGRNWPGPDALFDPVLNVELGMAYLRQLLDRYDGNLERALTAYNAGPGFVDRRLARGVALPNHYTRLVRGALDQQVAPRS
jgi:soluble lytic murein transglycosylase-like protein